MLEYIHRLPRPDSKAMQRGSEIHSMCEEYVKTDKKPKKMPEELENFEDEFLTLRKYKKDLTQLEGSWAFRSDWSPTSWFGQDAWCRMKVDFCTRDSKQKTVRIIDYKTGKLRKSNEEQLELYALGALYMFEPTDEIQCELWYLDSGDLVEVVFDIEEVATELREKWDEKARPMLEDIKFEATPSQSSCRFCSYSKDEGGPCEF